MLGTRPDLAHAVGLLSRFASNPSPNHFRALTRTFGYLYHTQDNALVYWKYENPDRFYGYSDSDWAGESEGRKSTSGYLFFLSGAVFSWSSTKQKLSTQSSMEAEYVGLCNASNQAIWINNFMEEIGFALDYPISICCDNQAAIKISISEELPFKMLNWNDLQRSV